MGLFYPGKYSDLVKVDYVLSYSFCNYIHAGRRVIRKPVIRKCKSKHSLAWTAFGNCWNALVLLFMSQMFKQRCSCVTAQRTWKTISNFLWDAISWVLQITGWTYIFIFLKKKRVECFCSKVSLEHHIINLSRPGNILEAC